MVHTGGNGAPRVLDQFDNGESENQGFKARKSTLDPNF